MGSNQKILHYKVNHKQNKKTIFRMGENICKQSNQQGINLQNIQTAHAAQFPKKQIIQSKKWAKDLNRHCSKEDIRWPKRT